MSCWRRRNESFEVAAPDHEEVGACGREVARCLCKTVVTAAHVVRKVAVGGNGGSVREGHGARLCDEAIGVEELGRDDAYLGSAEVGSRGYDAVLIVELNLVGCEEDEVRV